MIHWERYLAQVVANDDSKSDDKLQLGRIKVTCPDFTGDETTTLGDWIMPVFDWGWFVIPDVDEIVEIEIQVSSDEDEIEYQAAVFNPNIRWRAKRMWGGEDTDSPRPIPDEFKTNYGKRRGFATPWGHLFIFDDTESEPTINISWSDGGTVPKRSALLFDKDGTIKLSIENGEHLFHFKHDEVEIKLSEGASLKLTGKDAAAITILGDGGVKAAIADHLETFYGQLKTWLEAITVPTGMGNSGTPLNAPATSWDSSINSNKLKFPDG